MFKKIQLYSSPDTGADGQNPVTPPVTNGGTDQKPTEEAKLFTQAELEKIIAERLDRKQKQADEKATKDREAAEAAALAEQKKFEELANKRQERITALEAFEQKAQRYEAVLTKLLEAQRKSVPDHVISLLDKLDPADQLEWLATNASKLLLPSGAPATPKATANNGTPEDKEKARRAFERQMQSVF